MGIDETKESKLKVGVIFTLLKIVEVGAIILVPYWYGLLIGYLFSIVGSESVFFTWFIGLWALALSFLIVCLVVMLLSPFIEWNLDMAREIARKI